MLVSLVFDGCRTALSDGFLSTVWTELWLFEYMGDIHMSEVASLSVRKL